MYHYKNHALISKSFYQHIPWQKPLTRALAYKQFKRTGGFCHESINAACHTCTTCSYARARSAVLSFTSFNLRAGPWSSPRYSINRTCFLRCTTSGQATPEKPFSWLNYGYIHIVYEFDWYSFMKIWEIIQMNLIQQ
jgi:hypothetical protein